MEGERSIGLLIVWGTMIALFIAVLFIAFVISHKRKLYAAQVINDLLENECKKEIAEMKELYNEEIQKLKDEIASLKLNQNQP